MTEYKAYLLYGLAFTCLDFLYQRVNYYSSYTICPLLSQAPYSPWVERIRQQWVLQGDLKLQGV